MTWGIPSRLFLEIHVALSLIGIVSGLVVLYGLLRSCHHNSNQRYRISHTAVRLRSAGRCRHTISCAARHCSQRVLCISSRRNVALGLCCHRDCRAIPNCFVAVIQAFEKIPFLHFLAPTQSELPFLIAQIALLLLFVWLGIVAVRRFHPAEA